VELHASSREVGRQANAANVLVADAVNRADEAERRFDLLGCFGGAGDRDRGLIAGISNQTSLLALTARSRRRGPAKTAAASPSSPTRSNRCPSAPMRRRARLLARSLKSKAAGESAVGVMKDVREIIAASPRSRGGGAESDQQSGRSGNRRSANAAAQGAEQLGGSVEMFTGAVGDAGRAPENVSTQSAQVSTLFESFRNA